MRDIYGRIFFQDMSDSHYDIVDIFSRNFTGGRYCKIWVLKLTIVRDENNKALRYMHIRDLYIRQSTSNLE